MNFKYSLKGNNLFLFLTIIAITLIAYSNHFENDFHFDDSHTIVQNAFIRNLHNFYTFFKDGTSSSVLPQNQSYRPIVTLSLALDYWMGKGYNPFYFHLSIFIIFLLQGILTIFFFYKLLRKIVSKEHSILIAICASGWYLVHPAIAETINYIIARSDVYSTFFVIVALVCYQYSSFSRKTFLYLLPIVLGALAKPPSVLFAPILFFYLLIIEEEVSLYDLIKNKIKLLSVINKTFVAFIFCLLLYVFIDRMTPSTWVPGGSSRWTYLITQPFVILHYFTTFFLPFGLSADSDWKSLNSIWDIRFFIGIIFIITIVFLIIYLTKKKEHRPISFGLFWFLITLMPTSSIIPLAEVLNDHRMYFPFIGLSLSVTYSIYLILLETFKSYSLSLISKRNIISITIIVGLSLYAFGTYQRNKVWHSEESLWYDVTIKSPENGRGLMNYGLEKMAKGDYENANKYFQKALEYNPTYHYLFINLGVLYGAIGKADSAIIYFNKAIEFGGSYANTHFFYGRYLKNNRNYASSIIEVKKAIEISPGAIEYRINLLDTYDKIRNWEELKKLAENTLEIFPDNLEVKKYLSHAAIQKNTIDLLTENKDLTPESLLELSLTFYNERDYLQCIKKAELALKLRPNYKEALNNIGAAYIALRDYNNAIAALEKAVKIDPSFTLAQNNLSSAKKLISNSENVLINKASTAGEYIEQSLKYYNNKDFENCIKACKKALLINPNFDLAYNNICAAYNQLKQWDNAIEAGNKGLKINPTNQLLKNNLQLAINEKLK